MQSMDRNTVIGFVLLAVLLFLYLFLSTKSSQELQMQKKRQQDSLALVTKTRDSIAFSKDTTSGIVAVDTTGLRNVGVGSEQVSVVENEVIKVNFTNKGGQIKSVELKNYKSADGKPVILGGTAYDKISYAINSAPNQSAQVSELFFLPAAITKNADNSSSVTYRLSGATGEEIIHQFTVRPGDYLIDWNIQMRGADKLLTQGNFNLVWQAQPVAQEKDVLYERQQSNICFYEGGDFDYIMSRTEKKFDKPFQWVSVAQQFFNTTVIAKNNFNSGDISWVKETEDSVRIIAKTTASFQAKIPIGSVAAIPMQLYYGPNDYRILKKEAADMDKIVNLGRDFYAFVRPINKFIVMPVFDFFKRFILSYGLVIAFLTIFIRLLTSPLIYKSYLSGAKMKALRPEIEALKKKLGNDQQQVGIEQMKLFREAGVNPLGGCIPALLQIPIFFALYSFFNSNIALRGESFLWADDLSAYDVIFRFPFHIWGLGSHLSLFTLLAVGTSFLISIYNMNMTPDQNNPALKYMPYIFHPVLRRHPD